MAKKTNELPDTYDWYEVSDRICNMDIKGTKGKKYLSIELRVPLDPFLSGKEDLDAIQGSIMWGIKKENKDVKG